MQGRMPRIGKPEVTTLAQSFPAHWPNSGIIWSYGKDGLTYESTIYSSSYPTPSHLIKALHFPEILVRGAPCAEPSTPTRWAEASKSTIVLPIPRSRPSYLPLTDLTARPSFEKAFRG